MVGLENQELGIHIHLHGSEVSPSLERGVRKCDRISPRKYGWDPGDSEGSTLSANGGFARKEDPQGRLSELE